LIKSPAPLDCLLSHQLTLMHMNTKSFFLCIALAFLINASYGQSNNSTKNTMSKASSQGIVATFNGAWSSDNGKGFSVMNNGYFNSVAQDSTGKWAEVHAGKYTVNNDNTITFKILYSSYPDHVGAENTADYTMNG